MSTGGVGITSYLTDNEFPILVVDTGSPGLARSPGAS